MSYSQINTDHYENREIILQKDDRQQVRNTTLPPFRWICSLEVEFPEPVLYPLGILEHPGKAWKDLKPTTKGCGSGVLISPKHILTASHVIAGLKVIKDKRTGKTRFKIVPAKRVRVIPGRNEKKGKSFKPFGVFISQKILVSPGFKSAMEVPISQLTKTRIRQALASDFGVIEIQENWSKRFVVPGQIIGWWREFNNYQILPINELLRAKLEKGKIHVCGFPGDKGKSLCSELWRSYDKVKKVFPKFGSKPENLILYQADTSAGMSGSPVWIKDNSGKHYLVAIHSSFIDFIDKKTKKKEQANVGALITNETIRQLQLWKVEYLEVLFSNQIGL